MLSTDELDNYRAEWERVAMPEIVQILAPEQERTATGGYTETFAEAWEGPGRIGPTSSQDQLTADRIEAVGAWTVTVPYDAPAATSNRVLVDGVTYEITGILDRGSERTAKRLLVAEVG